MFPLKRDAGKAMVMAVEYLKQKAVSQIPDEQAQKIANEDGIQYSDVHTLELDFNGNTENGEISPSKGRILVKFDTFLQVLLKLTVCGISRLWSSFF